MRVSDTVAPALTDNLVESKEDQDMNSRITWAVLLLVAIVFTLGASAPKGHHPKSAKSDRYQKGLKEWQEGVANVAQTVKDTMAKPHDANELMKQEAHYVQMALELYAYKHDGEYPKSLRDLKRAGLLKDFPGGFPPSPYGNGRIVARGLSDELAPGALVYLTEERNGGLAGYWLIAIGKPDKPWNYELIEPLPGGGSVPADAVVVLESHIDDTPPMTKL
jgi:hypothetical protein